MFGLLRRPLSLPYVIGGVTTASLLVALYCVAYTSLRGHPETLGTGVAWAASNVTPWLIAIEAGKRAAAGRQAVAILTVALIASVVLGYVLGESDDTLGYELVRRVPALLATAVVVAMLRSGLGNSRQQNGLPLLPSQIDWVRAAGNYVELRANGRTIVHRGSIGATEQALAGNGFVRIHRSTLVRSDRIAKIRPQDVILHDGTHLKVGNRFRASLPHQETRPFVPQP